ncbi:MAG: bacterial transcriptional activator domain-containing protein [Acidimicrobiia bacterium]|nr:bacterial transcriptional activator domain-containing protein [Acidimicrobiia bacterium]
MAVETAGTGEGIVDKIAPVALVAAGSAFLGGTILFALRRLRSIQSARRRPGTITDPPNDEGAEFERRIRAISVDGEDVRYVAAVNSYLSYQLESSGTPMPAIVVVRAGQFGVEFLLDEPCTPVQGFRAITDDKTVWRLEADLDARAMEKQVGTDAHPFAPALAVLGNSDAGNVLVDLEQLGSLSVEGDAAQSLDFQRGLVASLCSAPWATNLEVVALGIDGLEGEDLSRVVQPSDGPEWAERVDAQMRRLSESLDRSPYEERVMHGDVYHPTVVIIGPDPGLLPVARKLALVAELAYSPIAVVSAHALASEHRIVIESDQATLEPLGLSFDPVALAAADLSAVDHLLANASDTGARPPAEDWATEDATTDAVEPAAPVVDLRSTNGSATARQQTTPTSETIDRIAAILEPKPIEVRILGRRPEIEGLTDEATPKIEAIIVYLAFHREVVSQRFREEFWPESTSRQAADNALMRARKLLGLTEEGDQRLQSARSTNSYVLCDEVGLDWDRVELLVAAAKDAEGAEEAAFLDAALSLVEGHVAVDARPDHYAWLLREPTIYTLIETTIVDAAHRRGELALTAGEVDKAKWAAEKGLAIVDGQEAMYCMKMQAAADAGDVDAINAAYREAQRAAESYGYDDDVQPETQELFESLRRVRQVSGIPPEGDLGLADPFQ